MKIGNFGHFIDVRVGRLKDGFKKRLAGWEQIEKIKNKLLLLP